MDSLATALYVRTDGLLKDSPLIAPWRPTVGMTPQFSDAGPVTLSTMQELLGCTSEARWLRHARAHQRHLFPYLPKQPGYTKRLRKAAELIRHVMRASATDTALWHDDVWYGYCASHTRCFRGRRLHLLCTLGGLPSVFALTGAKPDERGTLLDIFATEPTLIIDRPPDRR